MASYQHWTAPSREALEAAVSNYVANGFVVANRTPTTVTVVKHKQFSVLMVVIGIFLFVLPLLLYLVYYLLQGDTIIELTVALEALQYGLRSPDGNYWWDGANWQPIPVLASTDATAMVT